MLIRRGEARVPTMREDVFPAPARGWFQAGNRLTAPPDAAEVLDNFICTAQGARLRQGSLRYANCGASVVRLMTYHSGTDQQFYASTATRIYSLKRLNGGGSNAFGDVEGFTSGDWSSVQMTTAAGQFLVMVNGSDFALTYNGVTLNPISNVAINNVPFDTQTTAFAVGQTVTGGTSGASAVIGAILKTSATAGILKVGPITGGPFINNEALTSATGAALVNGTNSAASSITITGIATNLLSHVNVHKRRLWFVEKNTTSAWYLPVDSIGGAATEFDFGAVFSKGGSLLFTATWSLDSGSGLDDVFIAVSDEGQIAVYEGTDPASASTWSLTGVYDIGQPLNKHAYFAAGGDLAILTEDGIVPVSEALRKDRAALQATAISAPIEDAWKAAVARRTDTAFPISATLWQSRSLLLIGVPNYSNVTNVSFACNAATGAWSRLLGWDVRCSAVFEDKLYFGSSSGAVYEADIGGWDEPALPGVGVAYDAAYVPKFQPSNVRRGAVAAGITYLAPEPVAFDLYAHAEYTVDAMPVAPAASVSLVAPPSGFTEWQSVRASGYALAPALRMRGNQALPIPFEIVSMRLRSEQGYSL